MSKKNLSGEALTRLREKRMQQVHAGEVWVIRDSRTRGHMSLVTKKYKNGIIEHDPTTHAPTIRNMKNIKLERNFDGSNNTAYILSSIQTASIVNASKQHREMCPRTAKDKSVIRHLKKTAKKKEEGASMNALANSLLLSTSNIIIRKNK